MNNRVAILIALWLVMFGFEAATGHIFAPRALAEIPNHELRAIYPPLGLTLADYVMMLLVPVSAMLYARGDTPWRHFLWCGLPGAIPFTLNAWGAQAVNMSVHAANGYMMTLAEFVLPPLLPLIALPCVAVVAGLVAQDRGRAPLEEGE